MTEPHIQSTILNMLRTAAGAAVSHDTMLRRLYGSADMVAGNHNVHTSVMLLRRRGFPIATIHGFGYRFAPNISAGEAGGINLPLAT